MPGTRPTKMAHVVYRTRRFEEMLQWYQAVFGARIQYQNPALAFATFDDEHHRFAFANLSLMQPNGSDDERPPAVGVDHVGYTFASLPDLFENYAHLKAAGIKPYWSVHHGITVSMYYADPDGNQMEFQVDCCHSSDEAHSFMHGPQFSENPVGVEYDPDEWLARVRAGQSAAELLPGSSDPSPSPIRGALGAILQNA
jgi:catechol-2,3-dioxygenase